MTNTMRKDFGNSTGSSTVVPFRPPAGEQSSFGSDADFWRQVLKEAVPEELIKASIESAISQHFVERLAAGEVDDNPFDAIYFSELQSDVNFSESVRQIQALSGISDLSDTVEFDDGWDD